MRLLKVLLACLVFSTPALAGMNYPPVVAGQLPGTTTNDSAAAGKVGEFITSSIASGSAIPLTSGTQTNITSISLTPGDWDVSGIVNLNGASTTLPTVFNAAVNTVSATIPTEGTTGRTNVAFNLTSFPTDDPSAPIIPTRISISTTTTVYLIARAYFTVSTANAYGTIRARRVR